MNRVKLFRITVAVFTTLLIIATASVTLFISMFPRERLLGIITSRAEKVLNRKVTIGSLHYGITGLRIRDIAVYEDITAMPAFLRRRNRAGLRFLFQDC